MFRDSFSPSAFCRAVTKQNLIENTLTEKAYFWSKMHNLIPMNKAKMTKAHFNTQLQKIDSLYEIVELELRTLSSKLFVNEYCDLFWFC